MFPIKTRLIFHQTKTPLQVPLCSVIALSAFDRENIVIWVSLQGSSVLLSVA